MNGKITADMLAGFGPVIQGFYGLLYPDGLTMHDLATSESRVLRAICAHFREEGVPGGGDLV